MSSIEQSFGALAMKAFKDLFCDLSGRNMRSPRPSPSQSRWGRICARLPIYQDRNVAVPTASKRIADRAPDAEGFRPPAQAFGRSHPLRRIPYCDCGFDGIITHVNNTSASCSELARGGGHGNALSTRRQGAKPTLCKTAPAAPPVGCVGQSKFLTVAKRSRRALDDRRAAALRFWGNAVGEAAEC